MPKTGAIGVTEGTREVASAATAARDRASAQAQR